MHNNDFIIKNCILEKYIGTGGDVVIPEGVTSIGERAFDGCETLTSVTIPESVTSIGDGAFKFCIDLKLVVMSDSVSTIGIGAFSWCQNLESIRISQAATHIGHSAFSGCIKLKSINIPEGTTILRANTFAFCHSLTHIEIPKSISVIRNMAFSRCLNLTTITIPNGVTCIGDKAFQECEKLTSIVIPDSVAHIGNNILFGCKSLKFILLPKGVPLSYKLFGKMAFPMGLIKTLTSSKEIISDGALKNYILNKDAWQHLSTEIKAELMMNRQNEALTVAYAKCVTTKEAEQIAEMIVQKLPSKSSMKLRNNILLCIQILSNKASQKNIERMYEWVLQQRKRN